MRRALVIALALIYAAGVIAAAAYRHDCHRITGGQITEDTGTGRYSSQPRDICATP